MYSPMLSPCCCSKEDVFRASGCSAAMRVCVPECRLPSKRHGLAELLLLSLHTSCGLRYAGCVTHIPDTCLQPRSAGSSCVVGLLHVVSTGSAPLRLLGAAVFGGSPFATRVWRELQVEAQDSMQLSHPAPWVHSMHRAWRASWALGMTPLGSPGCMGATLVWLHTCALAGSYSTVVAQHSCVDRPARTRPTSCRAPALFRWKDCAAKSWEPPRYKRPPRTPASAIPGARARTHSATTTPCTPEREGWYHMLSTEQTSMGAFLLLLTLALEGKGMS